MHWLLNLPTAQPIAHAILVLCLVCAAGLLVGRIKLAGIGLGSAGVLFAGILFGHCGQRIDNAVLDFVKEFGLILFVFTIGLQLGPGFLSSLQRQGLRLNVLAAVVVVGGAAVTALAGWLAGLDFAAAVGLFSGATTNTPSLGAAQQSLQAMGAVTPERAALPALAYAVAYPVGIVGIIATLLVLRALFRIDPQQETNVFLSQQQAGQAALERRTLVVENNNLNGISLSHVPGLMELGVTVSRIRMLGSSQVKVAAPGTVLHLGDVLLAVGPRERLDQFQLIVGRRSSEDLLSKPGTAVFRRIFVTRKTVLGKSLAELELPERYNVTPTRVERSEVAMAAFPSFRLQFGDVVHLVGEEASLVRVADELGNSVRALGETQFIAIFVGIALGIVLGLVPLALPGLPQPVRLGLAGGPLIVAIVVSRVGRWGPLIWYMPASANLAFRELGITLFLACVGLSAGSHFFEIVLTARGATWLLVAVAITIVPLVSVGIFARAVWRMNYVTLTGVLAGSMTDPPALAFASAVCGTDAPAISYATVYPLTMLLRIMLAQLLVLTLCG